MTIAESNPGYDAGQRYAHIRGVAPDPAYETGYKDGEHSREADAFGWHDIACDCDETGETCNLMRWLQYIGFA